jgi:hypothetical protein
MSSNTHVMTRRYAWKALLGVAVLGAGLSFGCESSGNDSSGGRVISRDQNQTVRPNGAAVQTRSQVRETDSGTRVRETETRTREVVQPGPGVQNPDATQRDPGAGQ